MMDQPGGEFWLSHHEYVEGATSHVMYLIRTVVRKWKICEAVALLYCRIALEIQHIFFNLMFIINNPLLGHPEWVREPGLKGILLSC